MIIKKMKNAIVRAPIVAVAMGLIFVSTGSVFARGGVVHSVHVGGPDICTGVGQKPGCDANQSLVANEFSDGRVNGRWTDVFAVTPGFDPVTLIIAIDCLHVDGNEAWVSGLVVGPDFAGFRGALRVMDNGVSANDAPDMVSFTQGVPNDFDCHSEAPFALIPYVEGQVSVR